VPRPTLVALTIAFSLCAPGLASADVSGPDIVSFLNAQRAANGIPAGIVEDPTLSAGCAAHDNYGALNHVLVHTEDSGKPGYTAAGKTAAETSVLYAGAGPWTATRDPFEQAPIHLHQLLAPRLDRMGAAETQGYGCATTLASRHRPAPAQNITYTYPGDGVQGWVSSQIAAEGPYTPGQQVGIAAGTRTGPYLYVSFDGPALDPFATAQATDATLTGPGGPIPVAIADNTTTGLTNYLPTGMEVIPRDALKPMSVYTASVAATVTPFGGGATIPFSHTWSFTTGGGQENAATISGVAAASNGDLTVSLGSVAPDATVSATGPGTAVTTAVHLSGGSATAVLHLDRRGSWHVCVRSGGVGTEFQAAGQCQDVEAGVDPPPVPLVSTPFAIGPPPVAPTPLATFATGVKARQRGRALTVAVRCTATCSLKVTATLSIGRRHVKLSGVGVKRTSAGTVTVRFKLSKTVARRLRAAHPRRLVLTVVARPAKGASTTIRKTVSVTGS
jgi:hypothetical protein